MMQPATQTRDPATAEAANAAGHAEEASAIDRGHLARMTFGDRSLERELLELFDRQAAMLMVRMRAGGGDAVAPLAHTLKGSAAGVGALRVARAADAAEHADCHAAAECSQAVDRLAKAVEEARALIAMMLRDA